MEGSTRHASWLELFFDLVVAALASVAVLLPVLLTRLMVAIVGSQVALAVWDERRRARDLKTG